MRNVSSNVVPIRYPISEIALKFSYQNPIIEKKVFIFVIYLESAPAVDTICPISLFRQKKIEYFEKKIGPNKIDKKINFSIC